LIINVRVEIALVSLLFVFVMGFFTNLLSMRKMFVGKSEFVAYRQEQEKENRKQDEALVQQKEDLLEICNLKRAACAHMAADIGEIKLALQELFRELRKKVLS